MADEFALRGINQAIRLAGTASRLKRRV